MHVAHSMNVLSDMSVSISLTMIHRTSNGDVKLGGSVSWNGWPERHPRGSHSGWNGMIVY
jgi:hypothetical protein